MKLELKHLAPYLPYGLKFKHNEFNFEPMVMTQICFKAFKERGVWLSVINDKTHFSKWSGEEFKPILRPLADLKTKKWEKQVLKLYNYSGAELNYYDSGNSNKNDFGLSVTYKLSGDVFTELLVNRGSTKETRYNFMKFLFKNHFDSLGLIEKGLAIDINTLNK